MDAWFHSAAQVLLLPSSDTIVRAAELNHRVHHIPVAHMSGSRSEAGMVVARRAMPQGRCWIETMVVGYNSCPIRQV